MAFFRSVLFTLLFYAGSIPIVGFGALLGLVWQPAIRGTGRAWSGWSWWLTEHVLGIRIVVRGAVPNRPVIVAAKHQSAFETLAVLKLFDFPAVVLKAELMRIPVWGRIARRHGVIPVDRDASTSAMRSMLRSAEAAMRAGRPVFIFPEGSRMAVGETPPLKPGVAGLYKMLKLPVVPGKLPFSTGASGSLISTSTMPPARFTRQAVLPCTLTLVVSSGVLRWKTSTASRSAAARAGSDVRTDPAASAVRVSGRFMSGSDEPEEPAAVHG